VLEPSHREALLVVLLAPPTISQWIKKRRGIPAKERRGGRDTDEVEHLLFSEKREKTEDRWNMYVVKNEEGAFIEMWIEEIVLELRKRIPMGSVDEH